MRIYPYGEAQGLDTRLYAPDGEGWCRFERGPIRCTNADECRNPRHRITNTEAATRVIRWMAWGWRTP